MKFSIKDFFSKCKQVPSLQQIWSHLLLAHIYYLQAMDYPIQKTKCIIFVECKIWPYNHNLRKDG